MTTVPSSSSSLLAAWQHTVRRHGDRRAVVQAADGRTATFRELDDGATRWLAAQGLELNALRGRSVVFAIPNGIRWLELFLGVLRSGGVAVPLDSGEPAAAQRATAEALRAGFWWDGERLVALASATRFRNPATCLIKLTSGTTGRPRPLVFTAAQMLADGRQVTGTMGIRAGDLNYALIPLGHSYGLGNLAIPLVAQGVPLVCASAALPHAIADDFARWQPTVLPGVPAVYRALVAAELPAGALASLRRAISAGAPLPVETAREFEQRFGRRIHAFYGSSETGGIAYDRTGAATLEGGVGAALRGVTIVALRAGRIRVSSAAVVTTGNRRREGGHGAWIMADRVRIDGRGALTLLGRQGTLVKIAGRRVNLGEIAARLRRLPGTREVWVGVSTGPEAVLGAVVAGDRPAAELRSAMLADTAPWKVPKKWLVLPALPLTGRGKIDTRALQVRLFG